MKTLQKHEEKMWSSRLKNGLNEAWIKMIFRSVKQKKELLYCFHQFHYQRETRLIQSASWSKSSESITTRKYRWIRILNAWKAVKTWIWNQSSQKTSKVFLYFWHQLFIEKDSPFTLSFLLFLINQLSNWLHKGFCSIEGVWEQIFISKKLNLLIWSYSSGLNLTKLSKSLRMIAYVESAFSFGC